MYIDYFFLHHEGDTSNNINDILNVFFVIDVAPLNYISSYQSYATTVNLGKLQPMLAYVMALSHKISRILRVWAYF